MKLLRVTAILASLAFVASPQAQTASEYQLKAAFLYNFARFVRWPPATFTGPDAPLVLCILGADPFGETIDRTVQGKTAHKRLLAVRRLAEADRAGGCHIVFISASEEPDLRRILSEIGKRSVLTVSEVDRFAERGGMVNFVLDENRVRLEINVGAARRADLKVSSRLLRLASIRSSEGRR